MELKTGRKAVNVLRWLWTTGAVGAAVAITLFRRQLSVFYWVVLSVVAVAWTVGALIHAPRFCARFGGRYDGCTIDTDSGVWWRRHTRIPLSALRTFEVWEGPLHRLFGCQTVILRFAGGSALLPLLSQKLACRLIDRFEGRS